MWEVKRKGGRTQVRQAALVARGSLAEFGVILLIVTPNDRLTAFYEPAGSCCKSSVSFFSTAEVRIMGASLCMISLLRRAVKCARMALGASVCVCGTETAQVFGLRCLDQSIPAMTIGISTSTLSCLRGNAMHFVPCTAFAAVRLSFLCQ